MTILNKTIILGGSFDPVTSAHTQLIYNLSQRFDKVIIVPCKLSPFKISIGADTSKRLEMLKIATEDINNAIIDTFEIDKEGTDYTYITALHFSKTYKNLYFAIGSEMIADLGKWKNISLLSSLLTFYVVPRPDFPVGEKELSVLNSLVKYEIADFVGADGSSSEVKISVAMGKPDLWLDKKISDYIKKEKLYTQFVFVNDLYKRFHMKETRILHSFSTALCGVKLAKRWGVDTNKATIALLLHDIGKYVTREEAESLGVIFDDRINEMPLPVQHAEIGAELLAQVLKIEDKDIVEAVRWHTTAKPGMTKLEKVVYLADYIEPLRSFPTVDYLRKQTAKDVELGFISAIENSVKYVGKDDLYKITLDAYNYYCNKETGNEINEK